MSYKPVSSTKAAERDVQVGCWPNLFGLRRKRTQAITRSTGERCPPLDVHQHEGHDLRNELPPYEYFTYTWYDSSNGEINYFNKSSEKPPPYDSEEGISSEVMETIEAKIQELSRELRRLSLDIWEHPETAYKEIYAHDRLTAFMVSHGFAVTPHYLGLHTAWRATFTHSAPGDNRKTQRRTRVIGVNSEMDALPSIGHGCGHNLIAMSGAAVAIAIKAALQKHDVSGTVILLGTPAEETGGGKITLLERGAYDDMDACIMSHPSSGPNNFTGLWPGVACQPIDVEFFGHGAHASSAPWEAQNALDAAFVAYASISALRQQIKPDCRVNGIILGRDWVPNVIPDYAKLRYIVRAPTWAELEVLRERVRACFDAAALATACKVEVTVGVGYYEVRNNDVLGQEYARVVGDRYGMRTDTGEGVKYSTDFGNITFALPALHPVYAIPTEPNGSNHTSQFAKASATQEAHEETLKVAAGLAAIGFRVVQDVGFADRMKTSFEDSSASRSRGA